MGHPLDDNELKDIMATIDSDCDGFVTLKDFELLMSNSK